MIEVKFDICGEAYYFNTASCQIEKGEIKGIQIVPTAISKDEEGKNRLDGFVVLYSLVEGPVLAASELFASEEECREWYKEYFLRGGHIAQ